MLAKALSKVGDAISRLGCKIGVHDFRGGPGWPCERCGRLDDIWIDGEPMFGQETCMNCGWNEGGLKPKAKVKFVNGDAVCPQCGELCDYFDFRDE